MKKNSFVRTILINIGIFVGFLIILNFLIITGWEARRFINYIKEVTSGPKLEKVDPRALLPNYKNEPWAKEFFRDFNTLKDDNYKSYIGWRKTAFNSQYINIDSAGERITPQKSNKIDSIYNVIFLGGSTMWGTGAPDDGTIPAFFGKGGNGTYKVTNFGESGYRAIQSYIYLMLKFNEGLKTDWVISYDGVNEAVGFLDNNEAVSTYAENRMRQKLKQKKGLSDFVTNLTYRNFLLGPIENTISRFKNKQLIIPKRSVILTNERIDEVARTLLDSWLVTKDLAHKNQAKYLAVLQPNAALGKPNISYLNFNEYESLLMQTYDILYKRVKELLIKEAKYAELKAHVLDLTNSLDGEEYFYIDWCHVSPNGNKVIANHILQKIKEINIKN
ncbi:MAG: hypothetical protein ABFR05_12465 [Bacteroidota bacterium]